MKFFSFLIILTTLNFISSTDLVSHDPKVLGGTSALLTSYPSCFVTIFVNFEDTNRRCGGCVIPNGDRILTSASCISSTTSETQSSNLNFAFGLTSLIIPTYSMVSVTKNPNFDVKAKNPTSDVAVIKINRNAIKLPGISSAELSNSTENLVGKNLSVCGFGYRNQGGLYPATLMCTTLKVVESKICFKNLTCPSSDPVTVPDGVICTQNTDGRGICHGDEGSPVFLSQSSTSTVVGVISYVVERQKNLCGSTVVISQVASFKDFIDGVK